MTFSLVIVQTQLKYGHKNLEYIFPSIFLPMTNINLSRYLFVDCFQLRYAYIGIA